VVEDVELAEGGHLDEESGVWVGGGSVRCWASGG
jgi:hypothetical protein